MSKLEQLIQELCPDGVEFKPLWSVTVWDKKFNSVDRSKQPEVKNYPYLLAADLFALEQETGDVFLLSTGEKTGWTTEELAGDNLREGEVVTIPWGKSRPVIDCIKYYKGKFVTADNRIMTSNDTKVLSNKFMYYWIMSMGETIDTYYRGSGIKHPDMAKVLEMQIPVPPIEVQNEIVRMLDNFTELTTELTAKLSEEQTARKKQYEYYRDSLLSFDKTVAMKKVKLSEICQVYDGTHQTPNYTEFGVKFASVENISNPYATQKFISVDDYSKYKIKPQIGDVLMTRIGSIGVCYVIDKDEDLAYYVSLALLRPNPTIINSRYLKHYIESTYGSKE